MTEVVGEVFRKLYAPGSKSERVAVMLKVGDEELLLRRAGGNPFQDDVLEGLVGKQIRARGQRIDVGLIMESWEEV